MAGVNHLGGPADVSSDQQLRFSTKDGPLMATHPLDGTTVGADGVRHTAGDPSIPTTAPVWPGKPLRSGSAEVNGLAASLTRQVSDAALTEDDATVTSDTAFFTQADVGASVSGGGLPGGVTIASVTSGTEVELSVAAPADVDPATLTIGRALPQVLENVDELDALVASLTRTVTDGVLVDEDETVTSATASFAAEDVGASVSGTGIPAGTTIASVTNGTTVELSVAATDDVDPATLTFIRKVKTYIDAGDA